MTAVEADPMLVGDWEAGLEDYRVLVDYLKVDLDNC